MSERDDSCGQNMILWSFRVPPSLKHSSGSKMTCNALKSVELPLLRYVPRETRAFRSSGPASSLCPLTRLWLRFCGHGPVPGGRQYKEGPVPCPPPTKNTNNPPLKSKVVQYFPSTYSVLHATVSHRLTALCNPITLTSCHSELEEKTADASLIDGEIMSNWDEAVDR